MGVKEPISDAKHRVLSPRRRVNRIGNRQLSNRYCIGRSRQTIQVGSTADRLLELQLGTLAFRDGPLRTFSFARFRSLVTQGALIGDFPLRDRRSHPRIDGIGSCPTKIGIGLPDATLVTSSTQNESAPDVGTFERSIFPT